MRKLFGRLTDKDKTHVFIYNDKKEDEFEELDIPKVENEELFPSELHLHSDEWFYVEVDEEHTSMIDEYIDFSNNTTSTDKISKSNFSKLNVIYKPVEKGIVFQKITNTKRLTDKKIINFDSEKKFTTSKISGLDVSDKIDAFYVTETNRLYFKNYISIKSVFDGIEDYYREAKEPDIKEFKNFSAIDVASNIELNDRIRKKIATIIDYKIDLNSQSMIKKLIKEHKKYTQEDLYVEKNQFIIADKKQLNSFCQLVLGRFYENVILGGVYEATSAKKKG